MHKGCRCFCQAKCVRFLVDPVVEGGHLVGLEADQEVSVGLKQCRSYLGRGRTLDLTLQTVQMEANTWYPG